MELHGDGFVLRDWYISDAPALQRNADNKNIATNLMDRFPSPYTLTAAEEWITFCQIQNPITIFAIAIGDEVIGSIGLEFRQDVYRKTPLLGYWLAEAHWGKGIMPQAVKLICHYAFQNLDVICILAYVYSKNPNSMRVLEKAGFTLQGIIQQGVIKGEEVLDEHVYGLQRQL